jgi:hypothetical protein
VQYGLSLYCTTVPAFLCLPRLPPSLLSDRVDPCTISPLTAPNGDADRS